MLLKVFLIAFGSVVFRLSLFHFLHQDGFGKFLYIILVGDYQETAATPFGNGALIK